MNRLTGLIRADKEYQNFLSVLSSAFAEGSSLPIAVNGLTGGAESAFLAESVIESRKISGAPVLVLCESEAECVKALGTLTAAGVSALRYKKRDLVFSSYTASRDSERERLSVLFAIMENAVDAVVTTVSAASIYTMPEDTLLSLSLSIREGDELSPSDLCERLSSLGFHSSDTVEGRGQFAHRGGIVDFFGGESDEPIRVEFFGDEVDRIVTFDPISQRASGRLEAVKLLPASEVIVDAFARERMLFDVRSLLRKTHDDAARERLTREETALSADLSIDFRDKYLGVIYETRASLFGYFSTYKKCVVFTLGTSGCLEDHKKLFDYLEDEKKTMLSVGSVSESAAKYIASREDYLRFLDENMTVHLNPFAGGIGNMRLSGLFGFRCRRTVSYGSNTSMLYEDLAAFRKGLYRTVIVCENAQGARSLADALTDADFAVSMLHENPELDPTKAEGGRIFIAVGSCEGYDLIMPKIAVLSMAQDEGRRVMENRRGRGLSRRSAAPESAL